MSKSRFVTVGTKYFGGHSDLLSGVLVVKTLEEWKTVRTTHRTHRVASACAISHSYGTGFLASRGPYIPRQHDGLARIMAPAAIVAHTPSSRSSPICICHRSCTLAGFDCENTRRQDIRWCPWRRDQAGVALIAPGHRRQGL